MAKTVSLVVTTDPTHTEDKGGYPAGSVVIQFFPDDDTYPPGTEGLEFGNRIGSTEVEIKPEIAHKYDGWYFIGDTETIDSFPHEIRDLIVVYSVQSAMAARINKSMSAVTKMLYSKKQIATMRNTANLCLSIVLEKHLDFELELWPADEIEGFLLVKPGEEFVTARMFKTYKDADDVRELEPGLGFRVARVSLFPDAATEKAETDLDT